MVGVGSCIAKGLLSPTAEQMSLPQDWAALPAPGAEGQRGRQPLSAQSVVRYGTVSAGSDAAPTELCGPGGLVRSGLACQGFCVLHKFRMSQPGRAGERSGERRARAVREGIHLILASAWPSAESDGTPREFVPSCAPSPNRHVSNLLLAST